MKKFIIGVITIILCGMFVPQETMGQTPKKVEYNKENKTFKSTKEKSNNDQLTSYLWEDSKGVQYPIWLHTYTRGDNAGKVTCYVIRVSKKTGKEYKYYLPNGIEIAEQIMRENQ